MMNISGASLSRSLAKWWSTLPPSGRVGLVLMGFWAVIALVGPLLSPYDGTRLVSTDAFRGSSLAFPLGTDYLGRDMLSRIFLGARNTVALALGAAMLASAVGIALGLFATVNGRYADSILGRVVDVLMSMPAKVLALVMVAAFGSSIPLLIVIAALSYMPGAFRLVRALAGQLQTLEYVQLARLRGESRFYLACVEILPNLAPALLADLGMRFASIVLLLSGLGLLGLGVQTPHVDLGLLVRENMPGLGQGGAMAVLAPSLAIATLTIGVHLLVDGLPRPAMRIRPRR